MSDRQPTVFIVDHDEPGRLSCEAAIRRAGLPTQMYPSAREFLAEYEVSWPGCLLLALRMPDMSGLQAQQELNRRGALIPVIFVAGAAEVADAVQAMRRGAFDFLQKPVGPEVLLGYVRRALQSDAMLRASLGERLAMEERFASLSDREREILGLVLEGLSNKEAAARMRLSSRTVEIHRASLMKKTGARTTADLVKMAMELQLVRSSDIRL